MVTTPVFSDCYMAQVPAFLCSGALFGPPLAIVNRKIMTFVISVTIVSFQQFNCGL